MNSIVIEKYVCHQPTKVFIKAGQMEEQSTANHYCTASQLDGILPGKQL